MGKFLVRVTLIGVTIYFLAAFLLAQYYSVGILLDYHVVPFELVVVAYCHSEGKYHCKYIKHLSVSILLTDLLSRLDNHLDFLSVAAHNLIPIGIIALGIATTITLAVRHFIQVTRLRNERRKTISHKADGISDAR